MLVDVSLEILKWELIAILEWPIANGILLDSVIGQMDIRVITVVHIILSTWRAKIAFFEKEALHFLGEEDPYTDVELPVIDQERPLYVFLDHKVESLRQDDIIQTWLDGAARIGPCLILNNRVIGSVVLELKEGLLQDLPQLLKGFENMDATATILRGGFQDPKVTPNKVRQRHGHSLWWSFRKLVS
jgi:hypothetical protein